MKQEVGIKNGMQRLIQTAKEKKMKWMRIEPETEETLEAIKAVVSKRVVPAPHDMQPRESSPVSARTLTIPRRRCSMPRFSITR
jgi:hypothetical protein